MSSIIEANVGLEADDFENLIAREDDPSSRRVAAGQPEEAHAQPLLKMTASAGLLDGDASSIPVSTRMNMSVRRTLRTLAPFVLADSVALAVAGCGATAALWLAHPVAGESIGYLAPLTLLPLLAFYWLSGLYSEIWIHPVVELRHLTHINSVALLAAACGSLVAGPFPLFFLAGWIITTVMVPTLRVITRHLCARFTWWGFPALVIGSGAGAEHLIRTVLDAPHSGLRPVVATDPGSQCRSALLPVVNDQRTLESLICSEGIRHAVISVPNITAIHFMQMIDRYTEMVPHILVLSDTQALPTLWGASRSGGRISGIEVRNGLLMITLGFFKRFIDLLFAVCVFTIGLPIFLAIMLAIKLTSPGPIFFGHTRIGRRGRLFKAWKFRTMRPNSDHLLQEYLAKNPEAQAEWQRDQKLRHDPRVTSIGRLLRKTSLDELPQMWNVLKGEMSLIGSRPIVADEIHRYGEFFRLYMTVKPGVTGLWQVSGRNDIGYDDRVQLDAFYVRHWSPWLDVYILAKTALALMDRGGAY